MLVYSIEWHEAGFKNWSRSVEKKRAELEEMRKAVEDSEGQTAEEDEF